MLLRRVGLISITRDPIIVLILSLVLVVEFFVSLCMAVAGLLRCGVRAARLQCGGGFSDQEPEGLCVEGISDKGEVQRLPRLLGHSDSPSMQVLMSEKAAARGCLDVMSPADPHALDASSDDALEDVASAAD